MVAAWSAGAGTAQAEEPTTADLPSCEQLLAAVTTDDEAPDVDPCADPIPVDECGLIPLLSSEGAETTGGGIESEDPCSVEVTVGVTGDCEDPESFTFTVDATGLTATTTYRIYFTSADLETLPGDEVPTNTYFDFTTDANGAVANATHTSTEGDFDFPSGAFTLTYVVVEEAEESLVYIDQTDVGECTPETQPGGTAPTPTTPAPSTSAPTTPVAAPVVVTQPAAAQPAVLANTGTPVTAAALLGGGMLVAGAGALVATRRRSS